MPRSAHHLLVAMLIALHVATTTGCAVLHALPGWGHDSGLKPMARGDHSHGPGKSSHEAADGCAVCQFLAQGQLPCVPAADPTAWLTVGLVVADVPDAEAALPLSPSAPRGPPADASGA